MTDEERNLKKVTLHLSRNELDLILSALNETQENLEDWEFSTRTGFDRREFQGLQAELKKVRGLGEIRLEQLGNDAEVAYLRLKPSKGPGSVSKTVRLRDLVGQYTGPDIYIDFGQEGELLGIEIVD